MEPKLMSYITAKYASKSDMLLSEREWAGGDRQDAAPL